MEKDQNQTKARRLELQKLLEGILGNDRVYYQAPSNISLKYPCIIYELSTMTSLYANNDKYRSHRKYTVKVIDRDPDSALPDKILGLPLCSFNTRYVTDNLYHTVFELYY